MGVLETVRRALASPCQYLIQYKSRNFEFNGLGIEAPNGKISLARIKTRVAKIEQAGELAKMLDMYQYMVCTAAQGLDNKTKRERYAELRIGAIGVLTSLHGSLIAFKSDPDGQKERLDEAVQIMQSFMGQVAKHSLRFIIPKGKRPSAKKRKAVGTLTVRESFTPIIKREEEMDKLVVPKVGKGSPASTPVPFALLVSAKAMSDALDFAGLKRSEVKELAKELSQKS